MHAERPASQARWSLCAHILKWSLALASTSCGVHEYFHGPKGADGSDDFGPTTYLGSHNDAGVIADTGASQPQAAPNDTIMLGGTQLRKQDVIAFLHFGHSNMAGRATLPASERPFFFTDTDARAWMYHLGKMPELAKEPETAADMKISETNAPPETHSQFAQCVSELIAEVRNALGQPDLPVLLSDYERGATGPYAPSTEFGRTMIAQIAMVPGLVSNCVIIPTDGIEMQDDHHFNLTGHKRWSMRTLDLMQSHGWFPQTNMR